MSDDGYFIKTLFRKQSLLNILAMMMSTIGPIVTTILAGTYFGNEGLAIIAICAPFFLAASFFGSIISSGAQIVCTEFIAKDETEKVSKVYSAAIILTFLMGILICAVLLISGRMFLTLMAGEVSPELMTYYNIFVLYVFAFMFLHIPLFFSRVVGQIQIGLTATTISSFISIAACLVLINHMGIEAIALGMVIGTTTGFIVSMIMIKKHLSFRFTKELFIVPIIKYGSAEGLGRLYVLIATIVLNTLFIREGGNVALAVFGVVSSLHRFNSSVIAGIAQTLVPIVGVFHEERDTTSIRQTVKLAFVYGNVLMLVVGIVLNIFPVQIAELFGLYDSAPFVMAMPFYTMYILLLMNTTIFCSYYMAIKRVGTANFIPFLQEFALFCAGAVVLAMLYGIGGIWMAFPLSGVGTLFILFATLAFIKLKQEDLTFPLLLNRRLEQEGRYISFSVENDALKASHAAEQISEFCEKNSLAPNQTMLIAMSVEEIITLIINHSNHNNFSVSVRLFLLDSGIILRIRNTGNKFDAVEYYKANIADDTEKSLEVIGMKYIVQKANSIFYRQTFGVNSLVITL